MFETSIFTVPCYDIGEILLRKINVKWWIILQNFKSWLCGILWNENVKQMCRKEVRACFLFIIGSFNWIALVAILKLQPLDVLNVPECPVNSWTREEIRLQMSDCFPHNDAVMSTLLLGQSYSLRMKPGRSSILPSISDQMGLVFQYVSIFQIWFGWFGILGD